MKKVLALLLFVLPVYLVISLYYLDRHYFLYPIKSEREIIVRSDTRGNGYFGAGRNGRRVHEGVDLYAEIGADVVAARSGRVSLSRRIFNKNTQTGSGNYLIIRHPGGLKTIYAHLLEIYVNQGDFVRQGQVVGKVGKTGNANFRDILSHLHFEVREGGLAVDPLDYLQ